MPSKVLVVGILRTLLTTLGQKDPVSEYNTTLWNNGTDAGKETARKQKRKLTYISNIYVVKDPANPENEGKTFLYKYGKKIFDKLTAAMQPEFEDEEAIDPFDFWQGANFKSQDPETIDEDSDRGEAEQLVTAAVKSTPTPSSTDDDDEALSYFAKLAAE